MTEMTSSSEKPLVLVVDDDASMILLTRSVLEPLGIRVEGAMDGQEGLLAFRRIQPDLVLLDVVLPKGDGFTVCDRIRALPEGERTPVLMMTSLDDIDSIRQAYEVGATDFMTKPVNWVVLSQRVRYMLRASQVQAALAEQNIRDSLTGLYNRRYFNVRLQEELVRADRNQQQLSVLLCDLDGFKAMNDTQGHQAGDEALRAVAKGIERSVREGDLVFRWGGDEFVVILANTNREGVMIATERILQEIKKTGKKFNTSLDLSIGAALYPEHGQEMKSLLQLADKALYIAKTEEGQIHVGEEEYQLNDHTVKTVFQPVMDVRSNQVLGYEALSRDPQERMSILALFKKYQAVGKLGDLKRLCFEQQLAEAQRVGLKRLFVNVDFAVLSRMAVLPKPAGLEVVLEISESEALHDVDEHLKIAKKWRQSGFQFAMDDFGAGFISLPFIAQLFPDYIKIDRSTILQAVSSKKFRKFFTDLLRALEHYAKVGIIGEGIETEKELKVVTDMGIHLIQGYLFGKPEPLDP